MTDTIIPTSADTKRAESIQALRDLLDVLEANPHIPAPEFISFVNRLYDGTEAERFGRLHDIADAFGIEVLEDENLDRRLRGKFGPLTLNGHAYADHRQSAPAPAPAPRVVQRPAGNGGAQ